MPIAVELVATHARVDGTAIADCGCGLVCAPPGSAVKNVRDKKVVHATTYRAIACLIRGSFTAEISICGRKTPFVICVEAILIRFTPEAREGSHALVRTTRPVFVYSDSGAQKDQAPWGTSLRMKDVRFRTVFGNRDVLGGL